MAAAEMTELMPGAGPPPTTIATVPEEPIRRVLRGLLHHPRAPELRHEVDDGRARHVDRHLVEDTREPERRRVCLRDGSAVGVAAAHALAGEREPERSRSLDVGRGDDGAVDRELRTHADAARRRDLDADDVPS